MKEYSIPEEICNINTEVRALTKLRDIYAKLPFGFRLAKKCAISAEIKSHEFLRSIVEMYPELDDVKLRFDYKKRIVFEIKENGEDKKES